MCPAPLACLHLSSPSRSQVLEKFQQSHFSLLFPPHLVAKIYSQGRAREQAYTHTDLIIATSQTKEEKKKQRLKQVPSRVQGPQTQWERRLHSVTVKCGLQPPARKVLYRLAEPCGLRRPCIPVLLTVSAKEEIRESSGPTGKPESLPMPHAQPNSIFRAPLACHQTLET